MLTRTPNGHLHLALGVALMAAALIALATPISRTSADQSASARGGTGRTVVGTLQAQAATVSRALATPGASAPDGPESLITRLGTHLIPGPLLSAALEIAVGTAFDEPSAGSADEAIAFTLHEDGFVLAQTAAGRTVGEALSAVGVSVADEDALSPPAGATLTPGMHVYLWHAVPVALILEGNLQSLTTRADTVEALLAQVGIAPQPSDLIFPGPGTPIRPGMRVSVTTVRNTVEFDDIEIAHDTYYRYDSGLAEGSEVVLQAGVDGRLQREYRVRRVNGVAVVRELASETVLPPTDAIVAVGTYVVPTPEPQPVLLPAAAPPASGGELSCASTMTVFATWYTAASAGGNGITATGTNVQKGTVAVDPSVIPLGTRMYIPGYGYGVAADTGGGIAGSMIDLGFGANDIPDWATRWVDICVLD